jgi:hypothetical protein
MKLKLRSSGRFYTDAERTWIYPGLGFILGVATTTFYQEDLVDAMKTTTDGVQFQGPKRIYWILHAWTSFFLTKQAFCEEKVAYNQLDVF